jgi:predicted NUDIX family phosphoesterase
MERVMVLPSNLYRNYFLDKCFIKEKDFPISHLELFAGSEPRLRDEIEGNMAFQQLVAYTVVFHPTLEKVFIAERISGEERLIGSYCLGFGGHVSDTDISFTYMDPISNAAVRELREELEIKNKSIFLNNLGYVRDIQSKTADHIGIVFLTILGAVSVKEKENLKGKWVTYDELKSNYYHKLEGWSRYILDYLYEDKYWSNKLKFK